MTASALLRVTENYSDIMEIWNECLASENVNIEIKSRVIGCNSQTVTLIYSLGFNLDIVIRTIFRSVSDYFERPATLLKRVSGTGVSWWILQDFKNTFFTEHLWAPASVVNNCQTSLSHCFNHMELKKLSNLFRMLFWKKIKNSHLFQSRSYSVNVGHLIIPLNYVKNVHIQSFRGPCFPAFGLNTEINPALKLMKILNNCCLNHYPTKALQTKLNIWNVSIPANIYLFKVNNRKLEGGVKYA